MSLPNVLYIYEDGDKDERYFVATRDASEKDEGLIGIYDLREILHVRHPTEFRRPKTKTWFRKG